MNDDIVDKLLKYAGHANCAAIRIYNIIREVGRGELTADNALHQLVEDYHELSILSKISLNWLTNSIRRASKMNFSIDINAGQFLAFAALALATGVTVGFALGVKFCARLTEGR